MQKKGKIIDYNWLQSIRKDKKSIIIDKNNYRFFRPLFQYFIIFQTLQSFKHPGSTPTDIDVYVHWVFIEF